MIDHFERLGFARSPWIDPEELKKRFLARSAELHPDKAAPGHENAQAEFVDLNESFRLLGNSRARILHLLELEGVPKPEHVQSIPPVALDLFPLIAEATRRSDALLKEKSAAQSPMVRAQSFAKALEGVNALQELQAQVQERINQVETELQSYSRSGFAASDAGRIGHLKKIAAALGFLERWRNQLQERAAGLTF